MLCPTGDRGDITDDNCFSPWGVTLTTKDFGFGGHKAFIVPWI